MATQGRVVDRKRLQAANVSKQRSERLRSGTDIQVEEDAELKNKHRTAKESFEEQQHQAGTTLKCVCAESKLKRCTESTSAIPKS